MSVETKKYIDLTGLQSYDVKIKEWIKNHGPEIPTNVSEFINDAEYITEDHLNALLENAIVQKQVYYRLNENGDRIPVYEEAEGIASNDEVYYERSGNGSVSDPYVYTAADPQPEPGTVLEPGLYYRTGEYETTLVPTDDPVIDETTGEYIYVDASILDGQGEITEEEIKELFED